MERFEQMPAVALRGMTILPDTMIHFDLVREKSIRAVEEAVSYTHLTLPTNSRV